MCRDTRDAGHLGKAGAGVHARGDRWTRWRLADKGREGGTATCLASDVPSCQRGEQTLPLPALVWPRLCGQGRPLRFAGPSAGGPCRSPAPALLERSPLGWDPGQPRDPRSFPERPHVGNAERRGRSTPRPQAGGGRPVRERDGFFGQKPGRGHVLGCAPCVPQRSPVPCVALQAARPRGTELDSEAPCGRPASPVTGGGCCSPCEWRGHDNMKPSGLKLKPKAFIYDLLRIELAPV